MDLILIGSEEGCLSRSHFNRYQGVVWENDENLSRACLDWL